VFLVTSMLQYKVLIFWGFRVLYNDFDLFLIVRTEAEHFPMCLGRYILTELREHLYPIPPSTYQSSPPTPARLTRRTRCQFHQHFTYKRHFGSFFYVHVTREKLTKQRSYEKFTFFVHKMLTKLTTEQQQQQQWWQLKTGSFAVQRSRTDFSFGSRSD